MKKIVSVSLGSSRRDHTARVNLMGEDSEISRRGTDGDFRAACKMLSELDGKVDAIGIGGADIYLYSRTKRYELKYGIKLMNAVKITPVVDGSGLKNSLERWVISQLEQDPRFNFKGTNCLLVCGMDRFGMAESLTRAGCNMVFGDLIFALDRDEEITSLDELEEYADRLLPEISRLPIGFFYPTGSKQDTYAQIMPKHQKLFDWAGIIAGDFHFIRRYLPESLAGRDIITNTVVREDLENLKGRGVRYLVTTTPEIQGRSFGTNVLEAALLSIIGKKWEDISREDYMDTIARLNLKPRIVELNPDEACHRVSC